MRTLVFPSCSQAGAYPSGQQGPRNSGMHPPATKGPSSRELASRLKKLITLADSEAGKALAERNDSRFVDIRLARAVAAQKLKDIVDGKIPAVSASPELRDAIRMLDAAIWGGQDETAGTTGARRS